MTVAPPEELVEDVPADIDATAGIGVKAAASRKDRDNTVKQKGIDVIVGVVAKYAAECDFVRACVRDHGAFSGDTLSVQAIFEPKAPATVEKRASSITLYALWFETSGFGVTEFFGERVRVCFHGPPRR